MLVELDGVRVLIDPVWGERASPWRSAGPARFFAPPLPLDALPPIDAALDPKSKIHFPSQRALYSVACHRRWLDCLAAAKAEDTVSGSPVLAASSRAWPNALTCMRLGFSPGFGLGLGSGQGLTPTILDGIGDVDHEGVHVEDVTDEHRAFGVPLLSEVLAEIQIPRVGSRFVNVSDDKYAGHALVMFL